MSAPDRTIPPTTLADVFAGGDVDPARPHYVDIDHEVAERYPCVRCGGACTYAGFRSTEGVYYAYQVCARCRHAEPF